VGPCIFCVWDQPIDRPPLDLVGRPRPLIFIADSRACARPRRDGGSVGGAISKRSIRRSARFRRRPRRCCAQEAVGIEQELVVLSRHSRRNSSVKRISSLGRQGTPPATREYRHC
jgi:hypothetical protein